MYDKELKNDLVILSLITFTICFVLSQSSGDHG